LIALGASTLSSGFLSGWAAWTIIGTGAVFIGTLAALGNTLPLFPHFGTGLLGIVALIDGFKRGQ